MKMMRLALGICFLAVSAVLMAADGEIRLFDEFRDAAVSQKNYFSYIRHLPGGDQHYLDPKSVAVSDGVLKVSSTRVFTVINDLRDFDAEVEFKMVEDQQSNGKHHGFVGIELRPLMTPPDTNDKAVAAKERSLRVFAQIGRTMPIHDVRAAAGELRRTADTVGMNQSRMPMMEADRWYRMRLVCRGQNVTVWIDGVEVGTVRHSGPRDTFNPVGRLAFWVHAGTAHFRNLLIREASAPAAATEGQ